MNNNQRFCSAIEQLPTPLSSAIRTIKQHDSMVSYFSADTLSAWAKQLDQPITYIVTSLLPLAAAFAEAPVSQFHVGAVAVDEEGNAYLGANFEFTDTHIGQTIHAEQSAIVHAWSRGARELAMLAINYPPCGHCRQFINEVNVSRDFCILLPKQPPKPFGDFLPDAFGPQDLGVTERILSGDMTQIVQSNDLLAMAKTSCDSSHAPYSDSKSGIALQYADGEVVTGRYAENAAFNPSLPPLQMALNYRRLQGKNWRDIEQAVLVEQASLLSQREHTADLLSRISPDVVLRYSAY